MNRSGCNTGKLSRGCQPSASVAPKDLFDLVDRVVFLTGRFEVTSDQLKNRVGLDLGVVGEVLRKEEKGEPTDRNELLSGDNQASNFYGKKRSKHDKKAKEII